MWIQFKRHNGRWDQIQWLRIEEAELLAFRARVKEDFKLKHGGLAVLGFVPRTFASCALDTFDWSKRFRGFDLILLTYAGYLCIRYCRADWNTGAGKDSDWIRLPQVYKDQ